MRPRALAGSVLRGAGRVAALLAVAFVSIAFLAPPSLAAQDPPPDPRREGLGPAERLEALLERIRIEQRSIATLEAEFVQRKESAMLVAPIESRGRFSYAEPDRVRWEYLSPDPISMLIAGEEMTTWYRDLGQVDKVRVGRQSKLVLEYLGAGNNIDKLLEYFTVTLLLPESADAPYTLRLKPRHARISKRLRDMSLWIDPGSFLVTRLRLVEADGDVTDYRFLGVKVNPELPPERFQLDLPQEVDVREVALGRHAGLR